MRSQLRREALLWAVEIDGLSPITQRVLITLCKEVRGAGESGRGWITFPSFNSLVKLSGVSKGSVVNSVKELMDKGLLTRVGGNIKGDTTVYTLCPGVLQDPRSPGDLGQDMTMVNARPRTAADHKSRKQSPSTNSPNPKQGSPLQEKSSSAVDDSSPPGTRSLGQTGEREKVSPEVLRKVTSALHGVIRRSVTKAAFALAWSRIRVIGLSFEHFTVEAPPELIVETGPQELELAIAEAATIAGHLRERRIRIIVGRSQRKIKPADANSRTLWPAAQPDPQAIAQWDAVRREIQTVVSPQSYDTWFKPCTGLARNTTALFVTVPNLFFVDWLTDHSDVVQAAARRVGIAPLEVIYLARAEVENERTAVP